MTPITDWRDKPVSLAESNGGVLAFTDPLAGLVRGNVIPWPPPEITQKLYKSRQQRAFSGADQKAVIRALGYYCDLQSLNSEDAMTWSVFGPVAYAPVTIRLAYTESLFRLISPKLPVPRTVAFALWRRLPHPETQVSGGPEIDFLIQTDHVLVLGEAKWKSKIDSRQGKKRDKDQITLRHEICTKFGHRLFPGISWFVVLGLSIEGGLVKPSRTERDDRHFIIAETTWPKVCELPQHPALDELQSYYDWKLKHSKTT